MTANYPQLITSYFFKPICGLSWCLLLALFAEFIIKYIRLSISTSNPSSYKKKGVTQAQAKKNFKQELSLFYRLDEIARPIVFAALIFAGMSITLYITAKDPFLEAIKYGFFGSLIVVPTSYFYYGNQDKFNFNSVSN